MEPGRLISGYTYGKNDIYLLQSIISHLSRKERGNKLYLDPGLITNRPGHVQAHC